MGKKSIFRKKFQPIIIIMVAIIIFMGSAVAILSFIAKNQYWNHSHLQNAILTLEEYNKSITENDTNLAETEATVHECNERAIPVRDEFSDFFASCNQAIIKCFQDVYGVDVTLKLERLQVMESLYPEKVSQMVGGSYSSDFPDKLFMNAMLLDSVILDKGTLETLEITNTEFSVKMLRTIYIHEVIHYLGFNSDSIFDHFTEAISECLNQKVMLHNGIKYESITGYAAIQGFAAQIIECDPQFVREVLNNGNANMGEYFNAKFDEKSGMNYAEYYDKLIGLIQTGNVKDLDKIVYYAQYLTYEYCKVSNDEARTINETIKESNVSLFELKWFLNIY